MCYCFGICRGSLTDDGEGGVDVAATNTIIKDLGDEMLNYI